MKKKLSIGQYILKFGMAYMIGIITLSAIFIIFNLSHSAPASILVLLGAVFSTAAEFILDHERVPNKKEKMMLIWFSFLMSWFVLLILILTAVLVLGGEQAMAELGNMVMQADATKMIGVISLISLVYLIILFFGYGRFAQIQYDAMKKKGRI
ncbi:MAG: ABZJ_00895 family protein [Nitrosomonas sp.]|nr:ABZJ_00895 family protein [Nitrosomonas sp.]MDP1952061.1 ABZJ_00895 family protein [Nitrosomonas sp.]